MNLNIRLTSLLNLVFNDDDNLAAARSEIARTNVYCLAESVVISEDSARAIIALDPEELHTHVQVVETSIGNVFLLWRKHVWMISESRRYEAALRRAKERRARDTSVAKAERITAMARKLCTEISGTDEDFKAYRAHIAQMYADAGQNEARFAAMIADVVKKVTKFDFYIPLSAETLALMAEDAANKQQAQEIHDTDTEVRQGSGEDEQVAPAAPDSDGKTDGDGDEADGDGGSALQEVGEAAPVESEEAGAVADEGGEAQEG